MLDETQPDSLPAPASDPQKAEGKAHKQIVEQFATGELRPLQAIRIWLNSHPMKRGWYIVIILLLLGAAYLGYGWMKSKNDALTRERDKYEIISKGIAPNQPPDKRIDFLLSAVRSGFVRLEENLTQTLRAIDADDGAAFLGEFPFGYGLFGIDFETNIVSLPFHDPHNPFADQMPPRAWDSTAEYPIVRWPTLRNVSVDSDNYILGVPLIILPGGDLFEGSQVKLRRSVGVSVTMNMGERGYQRFITKSEIHASDPCSIAQFSPNPKWSIVVRIVAIKKHGPVMLLGVKQNPAWKQQ